MEKVSIMEYLPEEQRIKLMNLIKKLGEETAEKEKYKKLYEKTLDEYQLLKEKYEKLEDKNLELKAKISTSRLAISKAKEAFMASKSAQKTKRMTELSDEEDKPPQKISTRYQFENDDHPPLYKPSKKVLNESIGEDSHYMTIPKPPTSSSEMRSSRDETMMNHSNSRRKQEIMNMKQEIKELTNSMKKNKREGLQFSEKMKLGQQILRRFKKSKEKNSRRQPINSTESLYESDISNQQSEQYFENPQLKTPMKTLQSNKKSLKKVYPQKPQPRTENTILSTSSRKQQKQDFNPNYRNPTTNKKHERPDRQPVKHEYSNKRGTNIEEQSFFDIIKQLNGQ